MKFYTTQELIDNEFVMQLKVNGTHFYYVADGFVIYSNQNNCEVFRFTFQGDRLIISPIDGDDFGHYSPAEKFVFTVYKQV